jgi:hypothetical protein
MFLFYFREISKQREFKSFQNIKRKYFKNNTCTPNFLTYFEKQQIKTLHEKSPQEWTPETLSTCFPASPEIIVVSNYYNDKYNIISNIFKIYLYIFKKLKFKI